MSDEELRDELDRIFDDFYRDVKHNVKDASAMSKHRQAEVLALIRQNQLQLLEEMEKKDELFPEHGIGSIKPVRAVRLSTIEEMKRKARSE